MEMHEDNVNALRKMFNKSDSDVLTIWSMPGWRSCPLAKGDNVSVNCPLGFDHSGVPDDLMPWMKRNDKDGSKEEFWRNLLSQCRQCKGRTAPSDAEKEQLDAIRISLFKGRSS
ncbi:hypothetical protein ACFLXN_02275 [Chloroflexota bacterium]